jgi:magnesium chelatase subunit D
MCVTGAFPFTAVIGQEQLKLALILAAIDWRLSCLIRGEKGSGKSTAARGLAEILPGNPPFVNVPIGVTEDRLLGGISLEAAFQGTATLKPGLVHSADGGVLYIDEVNLLAGPLTDALLDVSAAGRFVLERDGFSQQVRAQFILLGSMNLEEGSLRPQLTDRFALAVDVTAPETAAARVAALKARAGFDLRPDAFRATYESHQDDLRSRIALARKKRDTIELSDALLHSISERVTKTGVRSLRADLAVARAAAALAAFEDRLDVREEDIETVLPMALLHRADGRRPPSPPPSAPPAGQSEKPQSSAASPESIRVFSPEARSSPALERVTNQAPAGRNGEKLDVFGSLSLSARNTGQARLRPDTLAFRNQPPATGTRFIFVVDCSGSQAAKQRMRAVKGVAVSLLRESVQTRDEAAVIAFRGERAEVLVEPTSDTALVERKLELVPTGGRTPLAHALQLASQYVNWRSCLILLTDGKANVAAGDGEPWLQALAAAAEIRCPSLVVDTSAAGDGERLHELARALRGELLPLEVMDHSRLIELQRK